MTAPALRAPARRGRHRLPLWRRLLRGASPKRQAGKSARTVSVIAPCIAAAGHPPYLPAIITAAIVLAVTAPLGVKW